MVDSKNLRLRKMRRERLVDFDRARKVVTDRFLDDQARERRVGLGLGDQAGVGQPRRAYVDERGRNRVIEKAVVAGLMLGVELAESLLETLERARLRKAALRVMEHRRELGPSGIGKF